MNYLSVGDMARNYQFRLHNAQLKSTLTALSSEVSSGIRSDIGAAVNGDHRALTAINAELSRLNSYATVTSQSTLMLGMMDDALDHVQSTAADVASALTGSTSETSSGWLSTALLQAKSAFGTTVLALNATAAGRYLFSGTSTTTAPMTDADTILSALAAQTAGMSDAQTISDTIDAWFTAPAGTGGYSDLAYRGSSATISGLRISEEDSIAIPVTANETSLRDTLKGLAMASLASDTTDVSLQGALAARAASLLQSSDVKLTDTRATLGVIGSKIEKSTAQNAANKTALELARTHLIGAENYDSATALTAAQTQLDTLYAMTSRLSALSLTHYL